MTAYYKKCDGGKCSKPPFSSRTCQQQPHDEIQLEKAHTETLDTSLQGGDACSVVQKQTMMTIERKNRIKAVRPASSQTIHQDQMDKLNRICERTKQRNQLTSHKAGDQASNLGQPQPPISHRVLSANRINDFEKKVQVSDNSSIMNLRKLQRKEKVSSLQKLSARVRKQSRNPYSSDSDAENDPRISNAGSS